MQDDILKKIIARKRLEVETRKKMLPPSQLYRMAEVSPHSDISMSRQLKESETGLICEFKRRSPSKGWIHRDADPTLILPEYEKAGATAISVLTDQTFFGSQGNDFPKARSITKLPILRKEFIIDEYQLFESRLLGADAVLLIAAALDRHTCNALAAQARALHLEVLLELHDEKELDYVKPEIPMTGINNRNLGSFQTNVEHSFRLCEQLPKETLKISESGIASPQTVYELRQVGFQGFLIGETFMRAEHPGEAVGHFISDLITIQTHQAL